MHHGRRNASYPIALGTKTSRRVSWLAPIIMVSPRRRALRADAPVLAVVGRAARRGTGTMVVACGRGISDLVWLCK